jgi:DNA transposition AAA+ family ATPase
MALTATRRAQLAQLSLPSEEEMARRIKSFLARSGMCLTEFADEIRYSHTTLSLFLNGKAYRHDAEGNNAQGSNTLQLRSVCKEYMDLHDVELAHRMRGEHVATVDFQILRDATLKALAEGLAYVVDGPPGTQKTWCLRMMEREIKERGLGRAVYVYVRDGQAPQELLRAICIAAGVPSRGRIDELLRKLAFFLADGRTVLLLDETQHLDLKGLEVLRQLLDLPPYFGVVLGGSHELAQRLHHWKLEQWRRRVQRTILFHGPSQAEARQILAKQLGLNQAEADAVVADCKAKANRTDYVAGKPVPKTYDYISAGLLFDFINGVNNAPIQTSAQRTPTAPTVPEAIA